MAQHTKSQGYSNRFSSVITSGYQLKKLQFMFEKSEFSWFSYMHSHQLWQKQTGYIANLIKCTFLVVVYFTSSLWLRIVVCIFCSGWIKWNMFIASIVTCYYLYIMDNHYFKRSPRQLIPNESLQLMGINI